MTLYITLHYISCEHQIVARTRSHLRTFVIPFHPDVTSHHNTLHCIPRGGPDRREKGTRPLARRNSLAVWFGSPGVQTTSLRQSATEDARAARARARKRWCAASASHRGCEDDDAPRPPRPPLLPLSFSISSSAEHRCQSKTTGMHARGAREERDRCACRGRRPRARCARLPSPRVGRRAGESRRSVTAESRRGAAASRAHQPAESRTERITFAFGYLATRTETTTQPSGRRRQQHGPGE